VLQDTALLLDTGSHALDVHLHLDAHLLIQADTLEIQVQQLAGRGVALHVADDGVEGGAVRHAQIDDCAVRMLAQDVADVDFGHRQPHRLLFVSVQHGRETSRHAEFAGDTLAGVTTKF
jgi:hypothetical protein